MLVACTVIFVVFPIINASYTSEEFKKMQFKLGHSQAENAFLQAELMQNGEYDFTNFSGELYITNENGDIVFDSADYKDSGIKNDDKSIVFMHNINDDLTAYYIYTLPKANIINPIIFAMVYICIFICVFFIVEKLIYKPLTKIEKVLHGNITGEMDFNYIADKKDNMFSSIFSDLNVLFENMKALSIRESNAQLLKKQAELDALQSQINPHFLYNTLEAIRGQALEYGLHDIELMTRSLSKLFRYSISNHNTMVTLREELDNIDNYLYIQHLRFNNKFTKTSHIDEDALDYMVPKLIIQPIVENAIYHGLEMKIGQGEIIISAYITKSKLIIDISDNGLGISEYKLRQLNAKLSKKNTLIKVNTKGSSIGLQNINARIRLTFGQEYGISVYSTEGVGTDVQLTMPLTKSENKNKGK